MYTKMLEKRAILSADNPGSCVASESYKEDHPLPHHPAHNIYPYHIDSARGHNFDKPTEPKEKKYL
jgi:hypothetical protein